MNIAATDLDRTLLNNRGRLSQKNLKAINNLRASGFVMVIATGRNLYSARKVIAPDLPVDYLVFASGCGVMDWSNGEIIYKRELKQEEIHKAVKILMAHKADFMIHREIPDNHHFLYYQNGFDNEDFSKRILLYKEFAREWKGDELTAASQILAVIPAAESARFEKIRQELDFVKVIRTTSPLDHTTTWLEIFPEGVSKGHTLEWLRKRLVIPRKNCCSLGNDYNDIDMLQWAETSYVVANAPEDLRKIYPQTLSNEADGFSKWAEIIIEKGIKNV